MDDKHFINKYIESIEKIIKTSDQFLETNEDFCDEIKDRLKDFYNFMKSKEGRIKSNALSKLIVKNFDLEQIWQQIELQNESFTTRSLANVSALLVAKDRLVYDNVQSKIPTNDSPDRVDTAEANDAIDSDKDIDEMDIDEDVAEREDSGDNNSESNDSVTEDDDISSENDTERNHTDKKYKPSIVDDEFFKLNEMEAFLIEEEKKLNDPDSGNDSEGSDAESEVSVDLFEQTSDDEDQKVKTARYKDFFVARNESTKSKRNKFLQEVDDDDEDETKPKSSFEKREERLRSKIAKIEEDAVADKPWQLKGEVTAESRPQNSLLEEVVEFDLTTRPAPVITEQSNMQLEDIIKQRIKDRVFDSVQRKQKPVDTPLEYKKKLVLDQEKSKQSLAQIYEKDYLEQKAALDPGSAENQEEEPALHKEVKTMMNDLFRKLDALSNSHFTPKPAIPEMKIVNNLPAINMEEVAPIAATDASLLAPEEVMRKPKGDLIGKNERTNSDKKRERRKKKLKQKLHAKLKLKKEESRNQNPNKKGKARKTAELNIKGRNITKMDESHSSQNVKSSTAFFSHLQEQVKSQIESRLVGKKSNQKKVLDAKKIKL